MQNLRGGEARAASAIVNGSEKIKIYEDLMPRMKRNLEKEKRNLRFIKTMIASEIEQKNQLEKVLRQCVDDVKTEIYKKKNENKSVYCK